MKEGPKGPGQISSWSCIQYGDSCCFVIWKIGKFPFGFPQGNGLLEINNQNHIRK